MQNLASIGLMSRHRKLFLLSFPYLSLFKTSDPRSGAKFDLRAIIWALLVEAHKIKLHAELVTLGLMATYRENSKVFPLQANVKTCDPQDGVKFDPRAII